MDILTKWFPNVVTFADQFPKAIMDTLIMLVISGLIAFVIGLPLGVILVVTKPGGILENKPVNWIIDKLINLFRAIPFVILIPLLLEVTRAFFHTAIGIRGALIPLIVTTVPFMARQMESSLEEIPDGVIEASIAMGMSPWQIINKVYLRENVPGMIRGVTITLIALVGQIAVVGVIGAGGLGDLAIRYGWQRRMMDITYVVVILILILISIIQGIGDWLVKKTTH